MAKFKQMLSDLGQDHLLRYYHELDEADKNTLCDHLEKFDIAEVNEMFKRAVQFDSDVKLLDDRMKPIPPARHGSEERSSKEELDNYHNRGLKEISEGNAAVVLLAGGQGTRLGVDYPKGMYNVGLLSQKSLFQIQAERILKVQELANKKYNKSGVIEWFIMTSGPTRIATEEYLKKNDYFGMNPKHIHIFEQGLLPCFDFNGKILMESKNKIALTPDGNGGIYRALSDSGMLNIMNMRGIKYVHVHSVDNILVKVADPTFIGYCAEKNADCGVKVVNKSSPTEAVGVVCLVDDTFQVVEYSEITSQTAQLKNPDGTLVFNAGNICNHLFTLNFLEKVAKENMKLHVAKKKIPHINENGEFIKPSSPNGIKIEKFIFDVFEFSENFVTWEVPREHEFSALKNANDAGKDCPSTAKRDLYRLHKKHLERNGVEVLTEEVEICPTISYFGEGLEMLKGKVYTKPTLIDQKFVDSLI